MKTANPPVTRIVTRSLASLVLGGALIFAAALASTASAADGALQPMADKAPALPLKTSFAKDASASAEAPYVLELKNESAKALKISATVDLSVVVHNRPKSRAVPAQTIEPGQSIKIGELSAADKVTVTADGFEPLLLTVPAAK